MLKATKGVYTFCIHSALYHQMSPLEAAPSNRPSWAQLYLYDTHNERLNLRLNRYNRLNPAILGDV
jgi:hypothetical protein